MNRRSFFKFLSVGAATATVAPKMLAEPTRFGHVPEIDLNHFVEYEQPSGESDYCIGVYTGIGLEGFAPSVISVMRVGKGSDPDVQVGEFVSPTITPSALSLVVAKIARRYVEVCVDHRGPMIVIEQVSAPGDVVQNQLKIMGFKRFYETVNSAGKMRDGWYSNRMSRPIVIGRFNEAVENDWYIPKSARLVESLVLQTTDNPYFHAAALSYICMHSKEKS